ncbi:peptidoglycan editing factor PgeF [Bacillus sp. BRMEA1]|uniref:peptidoglycan editing factor PgeF n=1 Tax=Neobacillus endophyticus TaxID=2738405 RepID=UPI0015646AA3|nr:peptidoglycan editing factor PgeF [Neobacillus endophyticus]NRD78796.1 peptidoglycan editing factor PgeF [Neobacillus endophyticus]
MEPFALTNESFLTIENWMKAYSGLVAGMSTKLGGKSKGSFESLNLGFHVADHGEDVFHNRETLADLLEFPLASWVGAEQIHDVHIRKVTKADRGKGSDAYDHAFKATDGFYTNEEGILLTLCFADCIPLFFLAPKARMIGTAHAGWKGTVGQIGKQMVDAWINEGIKPEEILVAIGPSICEKCYIVDDRVINLVENILEDVDRKPYNQIRDGQYSLDLKLLNKLVLLKAGVLDENIIMTQYCSSCDHELFFSHRRDNGSTGRMLSFIGWKEI